MDMPTVHIYTDGSIDKNPGGTGGYAAVLMFKTSDKTIVKEVSEGDFTTTNNRMEMKAVILGLESLRIKSSVLVLSDSQYVVKGMNEYLANWLNNGGLEGRKNGDLWRRIKQLKEKHEVKAKWIRGHSDHKWNDRADQLANRARVSATIEKRSIRHEKTYYRNDA